jgi:dephospho-CoA kinase
VKLGLTGDIGSGKSTVLGLFAKAGYATLSADVIVHELLAADVEVIAEVVAVFGSAVLEPGGGVNRRVLGGLVFGDAQRRTALESILHPRVRARWEGFILQPERSRVMVEIPLLFEKRLESSFDRVVSIYCSLDTKLRRLGARGVDEAAAIARLKTQLDQDSKADRSDYLILNNGSLDFLEMQVQTCLRSLEAL